MSKENARKERRFLGQGRVQKEEASKTKDTFPMLEVDLFADSCYVKFRQFATVDKSIIVDDLRIIDLDSES